jgi:hypothetical protein
VQETAFRNDPVDPGGLGVACSVQPFPDLRSANGVKNPELPERYPTEMHVVVSGQLMPVSDPVGTVGLGLGTMLHAGLAAASMLTVTRSAIADNSIPRLRRSELLRMAEC